MKSLILNIFIILILVSCNQKQSESEMTQKKKDPVPVVTPSQELLLNGDKHILLSDTYLEIGGDEVFFKYEIEKTGNNSGAITAELWYFEEGSLDGQGNPSGHRFFVYGSYTREGNKLLIEYTSLSGEEACDGVEQSLEMDEQFELSKGPEGDSYYLDSKKEDLYYIFNQGNDFSLEPFDTGACNKLAAINIGNSI